MKSEGTSSTYLRHECRTLLNHILGYGEMLLEEVGAGDWTVLVPNLARVGEEARRSLRLLREVLEAGRTEPVADMSHPAAELVASVETILVAAEELSAQATKAGAAGLLPDIERISSSAKQFRELLRERPSSEPLAMPSPPAPAVSPEAPTPPIERAAILVVDDDERNREIFARLLRRQGHEVAVAAGGREALELLRARHPDLVLLDVMMPEINGYEVLQRLKADPASRDVPVLMISAIDEINAVARCIELGAEDYLPKPLEAVILRARVAACLEKKRLRDQERQHLRELAEWNRTLENRVQEEVSEIERLSLLKRFLSPQLAELIVAGGMDDPLRTHRREIAVAFLDLRGFTAFTETAEPEEVMGVLREYHANMGRLVMKHGGTLERFTGDGMMVVFNDPVVIPNPAEQAARMALATRDTVAHLRQQWVRRGFDLDFGVGMDMGYATIGGIGFEDRWDYTVIGSVTNLAARLCGEAAPGQILVSQRFFGAVEDLVEAEPVGRLTLKGFSRPVLTYNMLRLRTHDTSGPGIS